MTKGSTHKAQCTPFCDSFIDRTRRLKCDSLGTHTERRSKIIGVLLVGMFSSWGACPLQSELALSGPAMVLGGNRPVTRPASGDRIRASPGRGRWPPGPGWPFAPCLSRRPGGVATAGGDRRGGPQVVRRRLRHQAGCVCASPDSANVHENLSAFVTNVLRLRALARRRTYLPDFPSMREFSSRWLGPPNSTSLPWCTTRSTMAAASLSSANTVPHLLNSTLVVNTTLLLS